MPTMPTFPLSWPLDSYAGPVLALVLVCARISGLLVVSPVLGTRHVPARVRACFAVALTLVIGPVFCDVGLSPTEDLGRLVILIAEEFIIGLALGLGVLILLFGMQLAGHVVSQMSGMALADVLDANFGAPVPIFAQLLDVVAVTLFVILGGHRMVVAALLDTFRWLPPGGGGVSSQGLSFLVDALAQSFALGIRVALPAIVSLLLSVLAMGLISRTLPQLNILSIGLSLNALTALGAIALGLGAMVTVFQEELTTMMTMFPQAWSAVGGVTP